MALLVGLVVVLLFFSFCVADTPELEPADLLLLTPESVERVEAAAKAGDIQAQSTLGVAHLRANEHVPRNVTAAVYWFHQIADRDEREFLAIRPRMMSILDQRRFVSNREQQRRLDLEYLGLAERRLAFELAFVALIEVYSGGQGSAYANPVLARRYMRQGAAYGFAPAQRWLGMAYLFGLLGVPKNAAEGVRLLHLAAAQGDRAAQYVLARWYELRAAVPAKADAAKYSFSRAAAHIPKSAGRLNELDERRTG